MRTGVCEDAQHGLFVILFNSNKLLILPEYIGKPQDADNIFITRHQERLMMAQKQLVVWPRIRMHFLQRTLPW